MDGGFHYRNSKAMLNLNFFTVSIAKYLKYNLKQLKYLHFQNRIQVKTYEYNKYLFFVFCKTIS